MVARDGRYHIGLAGSFSVISIYRIFPIFEILTIPTILPIFPICVLTFASYAAYHIFKPFFFRIASFQRRCDASYICLTLDTRGLGDSYKGPGYHLPHVKVDPPTGVHSYPAIFSYPSVSL